MVKIVADTSTLYDITSAQSIGLTVAPLSVTIDGKTYREFEEISTQEFLDKIAEGHIPTSSQPAIGEMVNVFESLDGEEILCLSMADGLSGTYNMTVSAKEIAKNKDDITVVDTTTLCGPHRYLAECALKLANEGLSTSGIMEKLQPLIQGAFSFLLPVDFDFLRRGGRCTSLVGHVGSLFHLYPIMRQTDDKKRLSRFGITRNYKKAIDLCANKLIDLGAAKDYLITVSHACDPEKAESVIKMLKEKLPFASYRSHCVSPSFVVQGGPGLIAIQCIPLLG